MMNTEGKWVCKDGSICKTDHEGRARRPSAPKRRSPSLRYLSPIPAKRRRRWSHRDISSFIAGFGGGHCQIPGPHMNSKGAFSLDDLMDRWGNNQGLSKIEVLDAIKASLFNKKDGRRGPTPRYSLGQGPNADDPIFIRVANNSRP